MKLSEVFNLMFFKTFNRLREIQVIPRGVLFPNDSFEFCCIGVSMGILFEQFENLISFHWIEVKL